MKRFILAAIAGLTLALLSVPGSSSEALAQTVAASRSIEAMLEHHRVRAAMHALAAGEAQDLADLVELTEIPAPPFGEAARAARFAEMLREIGLSAVTTDEVGNVIARRPGRGRGPTVALIAHMDTVFPEGTDVRVRVEGDTYYAPGVGDNTRGLVYLLAIARALDAAALRTRGDILFIGSVGEEGLGDLRGVRHLFRRGGPRIDAAVVIDGGDANRIVTTAVGSLRYRLVVSGPGGHSYSAFGVGNPHHALARIIARFDEAARAVTQTGPKATYNVGRIGGGTSVNSIPFESWAEIDLRSADPAQLEALDQALNRAVEMGLGEANALRTAGPPLSVELQLTGRRPGGVLPEAAPLAQAAAAAMTRLGLTPQFESASTDANIPLSLGVPAITLSRGGVSGESHAPGEWWRNENSLVSLQVGLLTVLSLTSIAT